MKNVNVDGHPDLERDFESGAIRIRMFIVMNNI